MKERPQKIWVLYGGSSSEREVSLRTGKGITDALKSKGYEVDGFDIKPGPGLLSLQWNAAPDLVVLGLHGSFGEDGTIQGFLESLKIPYVGSAVFASALCFHKGMTKRRLVAKALPCPFSFDVSGPQGFVELKATREFPKDFYARNWYLKPAREGSTIGILRYRGEDLDESERVRNFENFLSETFKFDSYVLIEEWVEGPEITVPVLHGKALPIVEIRPMTHFYDYESKYTKGRTEYLCPAPLPPDITRRAQELAELSFEALECRDYGRVDMIVSAKGPVILEMNTLPGMTETSLVPKSAAAAGLDYAEFLEKLVLGSFERQRKMGAGS